VLRISNLEAGYGKIKVLKGVSLEIKEGEIITLIGANGAGKTTLLKTICGLIHASAGAIEYEGETVHRKSPSARVKKGLVLVPEGRNILRRMTVYENLLMGAYCRSDRTEIKTDIEEIFERFPVLAKRMNLSADVLSGGEQQMLAIGRALMAQPRLLLLDEPSLGLAPLITDEIFAIVHQLARSGVTILLVEQNARLALSIADHGYVMENGRIVLDDTVEKIKDNADVKEFYLGLTEVGKKKSYRDVKHYKRRKRWLT